MDLPGVSIGLRSKSALMVTCLPDRFWGTRHECEQTPPHPYSKVPESTFLPSAARTVKVAAGIGHGPLAPKRAGDEEVSPPERRMEAWMACVSADWP